MKDILGFGKFLLEKFGIGGAAIAGAGCMLAGMIWHEHRSLSAIATYLIGHPVVALGALVMFLLTANMLRDQARMAKLESKAQNCEEMCEALRATYLRMMDRERAKRVRIEQELLLSWTAGGMAMTGPEALERLQKIYSSVDARFVERDYSQRSNKGRPRLADQIMDTP